MAIKTAIFDLDGTVLDTVKSIAYFCNEAMVKCGINPEPVENYNYHAGNGAKTLVHRALSAQNADTEENFNRVYPLYMKSYNADSAYKTEHFKGMPEVLRKMKEQGIVLGVVSNKPQSTVDETLPKFFPDGFFKYVYGSQGEMPLKPNPAAVLKIMELENVKRDDVLYVGDTGTDMETGKNAEVLTIGVTWGFRDRAELEKSGADLIISKPEELLSYI